MPTRSRLYLPVSLALAFVALGPQPGCTAAQGRAIEAPLALLGEAACEELLPLVVPGFSGAADVLVCKGAEASILGALAVAAKVPGDAGAAGGSASAAPPVAPLAHRPLRIGGRVVALVRAPVEVVGRAQAHLDRTVAR